MRAHPFACTLVVLAIAVVSHLPANSYAIEVEDGVADMQEVRMLNAPPTDGTATEVSADDDEADPDQEVDLMTLRQQMHEAVVRVIAKRNARALVAERKENEKKVDAAVEAHHEEVTKKQDADDLSPAGLKKIRKEVMDETHKKMGELAKSHVKAAADKIVAKWMKKFRKGHKGAKDLMKAAKQGVDKLDVAMEEHAMTEEAISSGKKNKKGDEAAKDAMIAEGAMDEAAAKAAEDAAKRVKSPYAKAAIKLAMKRIMGQAIKKAAAKVETDVSNHVVFNHEYASNGTLIESKMKMKATPQQIEKAQEAVDAEKEKEKVIKEEEAKLKKEEKKEKEGSTAQLKTESKVDKMREEAKIAKETAKEIENSENNPQSDTMTKMQMTKAAAKVKVVNKEAESQIEKTNEKINKGKVAKMFAEKMKKHSMEIAKKTARHVKEMSEKKMKFAEEKAKSITRTAERMENSAERKAERVEDTARQNAEEENDTLSSLKDEKSKNIDPAKLNKKPKKPKVRLYQPHEGPWGRVQAQGGVHVHVHTSFDEPKGGYYWPDAIPGSGIDTP